MQVGIQHEHGAGNGVYDSRATEDCIRIALPVSGTETFDDAIYFLRLGLEMELGTQITVFRMSFPNNSPESIYKRLTLHVKVLHVVAQCNRVDRAPAVSLCCGWQLTVHQETWQPCPIGRSSNFLPRTRMPIVYPSPRHPPHLHLGSEYSVLAQLPIRSRSDRSAARQSPCPASPYLDRYRMEARDGALERRPVEWTLSDGVW